jgi:hypothetical protein
MGFRGLEIKQPRSSSSATPCTYPEARRAQKKNKFVTQMESQHIPYQILLSTSPSHSRVLIAAIDVVPA